MNSVFGGLLVIGGGFLEVFIGYRVWLAERRRVEELEAKYAALERPSGTTTVVTARPRNERPARRNGRPVSNKEETQ